MALDTAWLSTLHYKVMIKDPDGYKENYNYNNLKRKLILLE